MLFVYLVRLQTVRSRSVSYTHLDVYKRQGEACFDRLLTSNICKCKVAEQLKISKPDRILQICHSSGSVKLDEAEAREDGLHIEGVLEVNLLYLTDDDTEPVGACLLYTSRCV